MFRIALKTYFVVGFQTDVTKLPHPLLFAFYSSETVPIYKIQYLAAELYSIMYNALETILEGSENSQNSYGSPYCETLL